MQGASCDGDDIRPFAEDPNGPLKSTLALLPTRLLCNKVSMLAGAQNLPTVGSGRARRDLILTSSRKYEGGLIREHKIEGSCRGTRSGA